MPENKAQHFAGGEPKFFTVQKAGGINTEAPRQSIGDEQFAWLENIQPIADGNFRALYSNGTALYTTSNPRTIIYYYPFNIGGGNYIAVFLDNGTAIAVNSDTGATTTITATANSFYPGTAQLGTAQPQCAQSGQQYLIIVDTAVNGYSVWDGNLLYTTGTLSPVVTITNNGKAYQSVPAVVFSGGHGSGAMASASISGGQVTAVTITNPGSGYLLGDAPTITLVGGTLTGSGASLTAVLTNQAGGSGFANTVTFTLISGSVVYAVQTITITNNGSGYSQNAAAQWDYTGVTGNFWVNNSTNRGHNGPPITLTIVAGAITGISVPGEGNLNPSTAPWVWETYGSNTFPTIKVTDPGFFTVTSVTGTPTGTNYSPSTTITASAGGSPVTQASINPVISGGVITGVTIINGGVYGSNTAPTLTVNDSAVTATATIMLMPFGVSGTCVETYQGRAWIGRGAVITFSAANSIFDFTTTNGAGAFQSADSCLRREYIALRQTGGFLYLFGDSSINVISNVQTSGSPAVTTFTNQTIDPQVGTPWHNCVQAMGDSLVFANTEGVYELTGSSAKKVSDVLDGIFAAANATLIADTPLTVPTGALMTINQKRIYMLVLPVAGPLDGGVLRTALVMWDGKRWWVGSQDQTFTQVATQEINSIFQTWGNTTTTIRKAFSTKSGTLTKLWQTKLWSGEGVFLTKQAMRLYTMAVDNSTGGYTFTGTYDYMLEAAAVATVSVSINVTNLTGVGSIAGNARGNYLGMTLHTTKDDFTLLSQDLLYQEQSPLGG